jgi:hypothetical protein
MLKGVKKYFDSFLLDEDCLYRTSLLQIMNIVNNHYSNHIYTILLSFFGLIIYMFFHFITFL